jgi:hypothetical protein
MKNLVLISLMAFIAACSLEPFTQLPCIDCPDPQPIDTITNPIDSLVLPPDTPCVDYVHITDPAFVQGYIELDNAINPQGWILHVGGSNDPAPFRDTIHPGEELFLAERLQNLLSQWMPQFAHDVKTRDDARRISVMTPGTNTTSTFNLKVWIRADAAKWFFTFNRQSFLFGGSVTLDEFLEYCKIYPSVRIYNLRDMGLDSLSERQCHLGVLRHDLCKAGEDRADWRFNNFAVDDSLEMAFIDAGWNIWQNITGDIVVEVRGRIVGRMRSPVLVDTRGHCATDDEIMTLLESGFCVVADE